MNNIQSPMKKILGLVKLRNLIPKILCLWDKYTYLNSHWNLCSLRRKHMFLTSRLRGEVKGHTFLLEIDNSHCEVVHSMDVD
jgi:hypothetical protein